MQTKLPDPQVVFPRNELQIPDENIQSMYTVYLVIYQAIYLQLASLKLETQLQGSGIVTCPSILGWQIR